LAILIRTGRRGESALQAGEKIEDDGEAYQRVVQFLEQLKVV